LLESIPQTIKEQEREQTLEVAKEKEEENQRLRVALEGLLKITVMNKQLEAELGTADEHDADNVGDDPRISDVDIENAIDDPRMLHYYFTRNRVFIKHRRYPKRHYVIGMTPGLQNLLGFIQDPNVENHSIH